MAYRLMYTFVCSHCDDAICSIDNKVWLTLIDAHLEEHFEKHFLSWQGPMLWRSNGQALPNKDQ